MTTTGEGRKKKIPTTNNTKKRGAWVVLVVVNNNMTLYTRVFTCNVVRGGGPTPLVLNVY